MALENILSQEIVQKLGWTLLHFVWQATAVAAVLAISLAVLRKSTANLRYVITCLALGLMVLLPIITMPLVSVSTPRPIPGIEAPPASTAVQVQPTEEMPLPTVVEYEERAHLESTKTAPTIPWKQRATEKLEASLPCLVTGWLIGVFGLSLWHLGGWVQLKRLRKKLTTPVDPPLYVTLKRLADKLGVDRAVELLESALVQVPTVVGWLRPAILLPASALTGLSAEQLEALLAHELAHIRRYDYLVNMLQTIVETLGFYHPAVWWVSHRIRIERENCCDDLAVSICGDRVRYARALTSMEELRSSRAELAVAASGGNLFARIRRLLDKDPTKSARVGWISPVITILLIAIISVPSTIALTTRSEPEGPQQDAAVSSDVAQTEGQAGKMVENEEGRIEGRIIDLATGRGISGGQLAVVPQSSSAFPGRFVCTSEEDGTFDIGGLASGEYLLQGDFPSLDVDVTSGQRIRDVFIGVDRRDDVLTPKETTAERQGDVQISMGVRVIEILADAMKNVFDLDESLSNELLARSGHEIADRLLTLTDEHKDAKLIANPQLLMVNNGKATVTSGGHMKYISGYESAEGEPSKLTAQHKMLEAGSKYTFHAGILESGKKVHIELAVWQQKLDFETRQYRPGYDYQIPSPPDIFVTEMTTSNGEPVVIGRLRRDEPAFCLIVTPSVVLPEPQPESLLGKKLPETNTLQGINGLKQAEGKQMLICFWDMNQRPSRNMIAELASREQGLAEKNIAVLLIHNSGVEPAKLKEWLGNSNTLFLCGSIKGDSDDALFRWGVQAQPWLILTDRERIVRAEGLSLKQLDEKLQRSSADEPVESDSSTESPQEQTPAPSGPAVTKSPVASDEDKAHVRVELSVVEVSSDSRMDRETAAETKNLLGSKITLPDSPAVADLLGQASEATAAVKDESARDERVTQEQFDTLFDLLVSRGYVKILLRPTLEVVEGQTAQIKTDQSSLEVTVQAVEDDAIDLQVKADLGSQVIPEDKEQIPLVSKRSFSSRVRISPGQSLIIGGVIKPELHPTRDGETETSQSPAGELMCIVTTSITTPPTDARPGIVIPKGFDELAIRRKTATEAGNSPTRQELQKPEAASSPQSDSMVTRVYDITDLINEPADYSGMSRVMQVRNLIMLIQERVVPESWYDLEIEGEGTITPFPLQEPKKLAVHNTVEVHREIERLLQVVRSGAERIPAEYPRQMTIRGRCIDPGGRSIQDARVVLYSLGDAPAQITESRTYSRGQFRLGPVASLTKEDTGRRRYLVFVPADGHGPAWKEVNSYEETIEPLELRAYNSATVTGTVVTEASKPVAGTQIWVRGIISGQATEETLSAANHLFVREPLPGWSTRTDSDGAFRIAGVPDRARIQLFVSHRDFAGCTVHVKAGANARIEVQPGATITGRVLYGKTGKPAAGVKIAAQGVDHVPIPGGWMAAGGPTVTDEQGRYRLESLPANKYNVYAEAENLTAVALDSFEARAGETREAPDLMLVEGGFIAGRVIDEATGQPVKPGQHSDVAIYGPSRPKSGAAVQSSRIRDDGSFRIRVAPGRNYIYLRPMAEWGREKATANPPAHWVEVAQGQSVDVEFKIRKLSQEESEAEARRRGRTISIINVPNTLDELENSAKRLKQLGLAIAMYANEHDDTLPDGLQPLEGYVQEQGLFRWLLENVEYLGEPRTEQPNAARVPIAYDRTLLQQDYSTEVLFLDFSVRLVRPPELRDLGIQLRIRRPTQTEPDEPMVTVDFRNVEIKTIVPKLAEWTGKVIIPTADLMKQKMTIHAPQKVSRSKAVAMIYNALRSEGYAVEQTDETIFLKPMTQEQAGIGKAKIQIEARILTVSDEFLKDIGLDANSISDPNAWQGPEPIAVWSSDNLRTYNLILDDLNVSFLLKAAQVHRDAKTLTSPRVTVGNREMAEMRVSTEFNYISVYVEPNGSAREPVPKHDSLELGHFITVKPQLTPDQKNIVIDFESEIRELRGVEERRYKEKYPYQIPKIARLTTRMQCLVPDGKTLLKGGQIITQEVERVSRIPLLSDLPLIGRFFRDHGTIKEERTLLILVKPVIQPQKKAETRPVSLGS